MVHPSHMTMFDGRTNLSNDVVAEVRRHFPEEVFETIIPRAVRLAEAPSYGQPITIYAPKSSGAQAYAALAREVLEDDGVHIPLAKIESSDDQSTASDDDINLPNFIERRLNGDVS